MRESEAMAFVAAIQAAKPWPQIPESTADAWAALLVDHELADAMGAVPAIARTPGFLDVAKIEQAIAEARAVRIVAEAAARPQLVEPAGGGVSIAEWVEHFASDEERQRLARVSPGLRARFGLDVGTLDDHDDAGTTIKRSRWWAA